MLGMSNMSHGRRSTQHNAALGERKFNVAILPCRIEPVLQQKLWAEKKGTRRAGWQLYSEQEERWTMLLRIFS